MTTFVSIRSLNLFIDQQRNTSASNVSIGLRGNNAEPAVQVCHRYRTLEWSRFLEKDHIAFVQARKIRFDLRLRDAGGSTVFLPYSRDRKLEDVLYARHPNNGLHRRCRIDKRQRAARLLLGKPPPQFDRLLTAEDVRCMARMEANEQIARNPGYRIHSQPLCRIICIESPDNRRRQMIFGVFGVRFPYGLRPGL